MKYLVAVLLSLLPIISASAADPDVWTPLQFLVGTWTGDGQAQGMVGKGTVTFTWEVAHQVLAYREHTEFAASNGHPASNYEALMVIYKNSLSKQIEANYFGSDNQVTHYKLAASPQPNSAEFVSDATSGPVFRLTYFTNPKQPADLALKFEVKMPGKETFELMASANGHKQ